MGLLDDAIREHLELKRRRGADATEISRQESDALGPVRRSPEGVPDLSDLAPVERPDSDAPAPEAPHSLSEETAVHAPPPAPSYQPPSAPPAAATPPLPPEPPAAAPEPAAAEEEPDPPSLLSRLNPAAGRMRHARRHSTDEQVEAPSTAAGPPAPIPAPTPEPAPPPSAHAAAPYTPPPLEPDVVPADDEPEGEDLLEETPEFLEETPEHDRLWFEQRPPRDFDFDG
jgi:hypothetical protein